MRWDELFADLEAQLGAEQAARRRGELADRSRRELATVALLDRLAAHRPHPLTLGVTGLGTLRGPLLDVAAEWLLVEEREGRPALVPSASCEWLTGLGRRSDIQREHSMARRLSLGAALRSLAQQRLPVTAMLRGGDQITGTIDRVYADHIDVAEHPSDSARRAGSVQGVRTVTIHALAMLRPA